MYKDLKQSVENLINTDSDRKRLEVFARERYDEQYPRDAKNIMSGSWHHYDSFRIVDSNKIIVKFKYGAGDYDYDGEFEVDMLPHYREEKINMLDI